MVTSNYLEPAYRQAVGWHAWVFLIRTRRDEGGYGNEVSSGGATKYGRRRWMRPKCRSAVRRTDDAGVRFFEVPLCHAYEVHGFERWERSPRDGRSLPAHAARCRDHHPAGDRWEGIQDEDEAWEADGQVQQVLHGRWLRSRPVRMKVRGSSRIGQGTPPAGATGGAVMR